MNIEAILYYLVLADSVIGNLVVCFGSSKFSKWYKKQKFMHKFFPLTKGWMAWYLVLVLWLGYALWRLGVLPW